MPFQINKHRDFFAGLFFSTLDSLVAFGCSQYALGNAMHTQNDHETMRKFT